MNQSMTPYHHGDLRNCAIIAAAELIESIGSYDITIAQVAKRVGVSAPALYRHFTDKDALLTAVRELTHLGIMDYITARRPISNTGRWPTSMPWVQPIYATQRTKAFFGLMWEDHGDTESRRAEARAKRTGFQVLHEAIELTSSAINQNRLVTH